MAGIVNIVLLSMATVWLLAMFIVIRRFRHLKIGLPAAYQLAITTPTDDDKPPQLIALAIDLIRKAHCSVPFDVLTDQEKRVALYAHAVETLPAWMTRSALYVLRPSERALIRQLQQIKTSRPKKTKAHFGAIRQQQRLRSASDI